MKYIFANCHLEIKFSKDKKLHLLSFQIVRIEVATLIFKLIKTTTVNCMTNFIPFKVR